MYAQNVRYPIRELGSCRDARECYLYCQIPENQPACWSYNKYFLNSRILGEATVSPEEIAKLHGITFPVAELGNCNSPTECFTYCAKEENQTACASFAQKKGLSQEKRNEGAPSLKVMQAAQKELGCESENTCSAFCNTVANFEKCHQFAQKYNLEKKSADVKTPSAQIIKKAKTELGCENETACKTLCSQEINFTRCWQFAQKYQLTQGENKEEANKRKQLIQEAKKELGCTSAEGCALFCSQPENLEKCHQFAQKYNPNLPASEKSTSLQTSSVGKQQPSTQTSLLKPDETTPSGATGCKTEKECKEFCQKNPEKCPGFPPTAKKDNKIAPQLKPASIDSPVITAMPNQTQNSQMPPPIATSSQTNQTVTPINTFH